MTQKYIYLLFLIMSGFSCHAFSNNIKAYQKYNREGYKISDTVYFYLDTADIAHNKNVKETPNEDGAIYEFVCDCVKENIKNLLIQGLKRKNRKVITKQQFDSLKFVDFKTAIKVLKLDPGYIRFTTGVLVPLHKQHTLIIVEPLGNEYNKNKFYIFNPTSNINWNYGPTE